MIVTHVLNRTMFTVTLIRLGKTQRDVARELGWAESRLSDTVRGRRRLTHEQARAVASVLGVPVRRITATEAAGRVPGP